MLQKIKGQENALELLNKAIENDRIAQAYLFYGSDGVGKFTAALNFGMAVNCLATSELKPCGKCDACHKFLQLEHPDFVYLFPTPNLNLSAEGEIKNTEAQKSYEAYLQNKINTPWKDFFFKESTEIRKESIALLNKRLELSIHEAKYRIVIIEDADMMNNATANAFLKTLEEPPERTIIILITERLPLILPTILSRTQPVYFKPLTRSVIEEILINEFEINSAFARSASRICAGNLKTAIRIASESESLSSNWAFEIFSLAAKEDDLGYLDLAEKYKKNQTIDQVIDLLKYIRIIASDLGSLISNPESEITNIDKIDFLKPMAEANPKIDDQLYDFLLFLEELNRKVEGYANLNLVLINLYLNCKLLLKP